MHNYIILKNNLPTECLYHKGYGTLVVDVAGDHNDDNDKGFLVVFQNALVDTNFFFFGSLVLNAQCGQGQVKHYQAAKHAVQSLACQS